MFILLSENTVLIGQKDSHNLQVRDKSRYNLFKTDKNLYSNDFRKFGQIPLYFLNFYFSAVFPSFSISPTMPFKRFNGEKKV